MKLQPFIVGITGGTGSGKTTVAAGLAAALGSGRATVIDADSYYRDLSHLPLHERHQLNFDHPDSLDLRLLAGHLQMLRQGRPVTRNFYDFTRHMLSGRTVVVEPAAVIIVEGLLIFATGELRRLFDLKVFLDEAADIRLLRRIMRDTAERGRTVQSVARQYLEQVRPMHARFVEPARQHADIVCAPGTGLADTIELLGARIERCSR